VVGNRVIEIEPAKPPVCEVEFYFLAQHSLGANAEAVANSNSGSIEGRPMAL
jgi:hypothetical protein